MSSELHLGRWQSAIAGPLAGRTFDHLITDAPFSARTHEGNEGIEHADGSERAELPYEHLTREDVAEAVRLLEPVVAGWFCVFTDSDLVNDWRYALEATGRLVFAPLACVVPGRSVRLLGDGPANWTDWLVVGRPRSKAFSSWGALPGAYVQPLGQDRERLVPGAKTIWMMRAIVRHYSRPGELILDPFMGSGTTGEAARVEGRRFVGIEADEGRFSMSSSRLGRPITPSLPGLE